MEQKKYFKEGDVVTLRQKLPNRPTMMVDNVAKQRDYKSVDDTDKKALIAIRCLWFTKEGHIQKNNFNFKDLVHVSTN